MIVGAPGSGKSTLARALGARTGLPVHHLDRVHYAEDWVERPDDEVLRLVRALHARPRWIIEGGISRTWGERFARADTFVWLDVPAGRRLGRVVRRTLRHRGRVRPELPAGCAEGLDRRTLAFLLWVWRTRRTAGAKARLLLEDACGRTDLVAFHLRDDAGIDRFLERVAPSPEAEHG